MAGGRPRANEVLVQPVDVIPPNLMVQNMKFRDLVVQAGLYEADSTTSIQWLATHGLLSNTRTCPVCPGNVRCRIMRRADAVNDRREWRCPNFLVFHFKKSLRANHSSPEVI